VEGRTPANCPQVKVRGAALVVAAVLIGGCADTDATRAPEVAAPTTATTSAGAVSWSGVQEILDRPHGSYTKTTTVSDGVDEEVISEEVVVYRTDGFRDRRLSLPGQEGDGPHLRFVHRPGEILMWNPSLVDQCGTAWVDLPPGDVEAVTGMTIPDDLGRAEPVAVLADRRSEPAVIKTTATFTVFEVTVGGATGLAMTSAIAESPQARAKLEELAAGQRTAEVLATPGGLVELSVDITDELSALAAAGDREGVGEGSVSVRWMFDASPRPVEEPTNERVAESSCLS
jgi:hypothetical protein